MGAGGPRSAWPSAYVARWRAPPPEPLGELVDIAAEHCVLTAGQGADLHDTPPTGGRRDAHEDAATLDEQGSQQPDEADE